MKRKIAIVVINVAAGLFALYTYACYVRETEIQNTQDNITCDIVELDLRHGYRHYPSAKIIYSGKEYYPSITINLTDSLSLGENNTVFYYDGVLDRVFCRDSGIERGVYSGFAFFILSFLFWLNPKSNKNKKDFSRGGKR